MVWENTLFVFSKWVFWEQKKLQSVFHVNFASSYFYFCFWGNKRVSFSAMHQYARNDTILQRPITMRTKNKSCFFLVGVKSKGFTFTVFGSEISERRLTVCGWNQTSASNLIWFPSKNNFHSGVSFNEKNSCFGECHLKHRSPLGDTNELLE